MAVHNSTNPGSTATPGSATTPGSAGRTPGAPPAGKKMSLSDKLQSYLSHLSLSEEGYKYIEILKGLNVEQGDRFIIAPCSDGLAEMVLVSNKLRTAGVLLVFGENTLPRVEGAPVILSANDMSTKLKSQGVELLDKLVIIPEDYPFVQNVHKHIVRLMDVHEGAATAVWTIQELTGYDVVINPSLSAVDKAIRTEQCHGVMPRYEFGALVALRKKGTAMDIDAPRHDLPLFVFAGYTDFVRTEVPTAAYGLGPTYRFAPTVHISYVRATIPSPTILGLLLPTVANLCIRRAHWVQSFQRFDDNTPNIGSLAQDAATGKDSRVKDVADLMNFLHQVTTYPTTDLVLDMNLGTAQLPWWSPLMQNQVGFANNLAKFFGAPVAEVPTMLTNASIVDWTGIVYENGKWQDSRIMDYLRLRHQKADRASLECFINRYLNQPHLRAKYLMELGPNYFRPLYYNQLVGFQAPFISWLASKVIGAGINFHFGEHSPMDQHTACSADVLLNADALRNMQSIVSAYSQYGMGNGFVF